MKLSRRVLSVEPSITLSLNARALQLTRQGIDLVKLAVGEPDIDTPEVVAQAGIQAIEERKARYTPTAGIPRLREAICSYMKNLYGMDFEPAEVMASSGAKHVLFNALQTMSEDGDEVLVPTPYWVSYPEMVRLAGARPVPVETRKEDHFKLQPADLEAAITPKTTAIFLNSPSNPTGAAYSLDELNALAQVLRRHDIWVISDDIYSTILFDGHRFASMAQADGMRERTLVVNGVSKTFSMTGWRLGFGVGPKDLIAAMTRLQDHSTSCPSAISQVAGAEALEQGPGLTADWVSSLQGRRNLMLEELGKIPGVDCPVPEGAFYLFADVGDYLRPHTDLADSMALTEYLIDKARVVVVPGEAFGAPGFIRLSFAVDDETIREGCRRMAEALSALK